jgi:hypothetical protein
MNLTNYTPGAGVEDLGSDSGRKHETAQGLEWILTAEFGSRLEQTADARTKLVVPSSTNCKGWDYPRRPISRFLEAAKAI